MHREDQQLVRQLLRGDEAAFRLFFEDYFPRMFRFILRRVEGDQDAAKDIVQAALARGVRKLELYRGEASLFTWFCQIARHELSDHLSRTARRLPTSYVFVARENDHAVRASLESMPSDSDAEPEAVQQRREVAAFVHAALDYLPHRYAQVLELKYIDDLPVETIAEQLGVTAIAVQSLLARARSAFREICGTLQPNVDDLPFSQSSRIDGGTR